MELEGDKDRAQIVRVIQGIVQLAGGRFVNKTNLFKAYYWAHRYYWRDHGRPLTRRHHIVHMPNGPGIDGFGRLLSWMEEQGLVREEVATGRYAKCTYHLLSPVELCDDELDSIRSAVKRVDGRRSGSVSDESHDESRAWREGKKGDPLDPYYDEIDERILRRTNRALPEIEELINDVFGPGAR